MSRSPLARWLASYRPLTTYTRLRSRGLALFPPHKTICTTKLYPRKSTSMRSIARSRPLCSGQGSAPRPDIRAHVKRPTRSHHETLTFAEARSAEQVPAAIARLQQCEQRCETVR